MDMALQPPLAATGQVTLTVPDFLDWLKVHNRLRTLLAEEVAVEAARAAGLIVSIERVKRAIAAELGPQVLQDCWRSLYGMDIPADGLANYLSRLSEIGLVALKQEMIRQLPPPVARLMNPVAPSQMPVVLDCSWAGNSLVTVNWGDGTPPQTSLGVGHLYQTHLYPSPGSYRIMITFAIGDITFSQTLTVTEAL